MKQLILLIILFWLSTSTIGQTNIYHPYVTDSVMRTTYWIYSMGNEEYFCYNWIGDTTINSTLYSKCSRVSNNPTPHLVYYGGLRQDIPNEKLYYIDLSNTEYDISVNQHLNIGDTLQIPCKFFEAFKIGFCYDPDDGTAIITKIDSILIGTTYLKKYQTGASLSYSFNPLVFICGIGIYEITGFEYGYTLYCYAVNNVSLIGPPLSICHCSLLTDMKEPATAIDAISIRPNPVRDYLEIEIGNLSEDNSFIITNILGQSVLERNITENKSLIDLSNLTGGIYFMRVEHNKTVCNYKIIKE